MKLDVPFFSNTEDNTHCHQASLRMVMAYFWPEKDFTWDEMDALTHKVQGKATWEYAGNIWLSDQGMEVRVIQSFDDRAFAELGTAYIEKFAGPEVAAWQESHSNIAQEQKLALESMRKLHVETRVPTVGDIRDALSQGYLGVCNVNAKALDGREGYDGHSIALIGYTDAGLYIHDPGLPPEPDRFVTHEVFERAWAYPNVQVKSLYLFRNGIVHK